MTLQQAQVRDFQSIADATVEFGDFTVLLGPSSSGKSAFLRALRGCLRNTVVPANVRLGTTKTQISVTFGDARIEIDRGKSLSTYRLHHDDTTETFTKSGRTVPEELAKVIRLPLIEEVDPSFIFQFDRPFLLSEAGSKAAQVIGSLTNVSTLHAAVREANRRRQEAAGTLKVRIGDIARLRGQLQDFVGLPARKLQLDQAQEALEATESLQSEASALRSALNLARAAQSALDSLEAVEPVDVSEPLAQAQRLVEERQEITRAVSRVRDLGISLRSDAERARSLKAEVEDLDARYAQTLQDLGVCPTCGQSTDGHE